jgi:spore coat polysaccharide biosynthesis protein SpsF
MTSTRLPGKVLKPLGYGNGTILENVITRVRAASNIDTVVVACTVNGADDVIVPVAESAGASVFRGSEEDVLSRYYLAAKEYGLDTVVRVTADCPFIDAGVLDDLVGFFDAGGYDYASNAIERTYPHGLDCEIFSFAALEAAMREGRTKPEREHVTYYIYTHPEAFKIGGLRLPDGENYHDLRITVDTEADYALACVLSDLLGGGSFTFRDIIGIFEERPYLRLINGNIRQKCTCSTLAEEVAEAVTYLRLQDLPRAAEVLAAASVK